MKKGDWIWLAISIILIIFSIRNCDSCAKDDDTDKGDSGGITSSEGVTDNDNGSGSSGGSPNSSSGSSGSSGSPSVPKKAVVSLYDEKGNLLKKYTYTDQEDNTIDVSEFSKTGYKLDGIYDYATRSVMLFNANGYQSPMVILDQDYKAIVKYSPITYQLVFEAGDGRLANASEYSRNISYDEAVGLFPETMYDGMELEGWYDANGNRYSSGITPIYSEFNTSGFEIGENEIIKLYARYKEKYCNVSLIYGDGTTTSLKVQYGKKLPDDMSKYFKDSGSSEVKGFGISYGVTVEYTDNIYTDMELYAIWKDYTYVSFVYAENDIRPAKVYRESNGTAKLEDGERAGYIFDGWYSSELLSGNKITTVSYGSLAKTYYAKWSLATYTILFIADGKQVYSADFNIENTNITVPEVPEKAHYTGKWEEYVLEYKDMTVFAVYEPESYTLSLFTGSDYSTANVKYGESFKLSVPSQKGKIFEGWYYNGNQITDDSGSSLEPYKFDSAISLTAKWSGIKYTLSFATNGGSEIDSVIIESGVPYTLTQAPVRNGYYFAGWFDAKMTTEYFDTITITSDTTVYAKWIVSQAISDVDDLKAIADNPYGNYHLTCNINLKGEEWMPIENFYGIFNGNGYKIYNFSLKKDDGNLAFILNNEGTIKNLTISNVEFSSTVTTSATYIQGILCAYNKGNLLNISTSSIIMLLNLSTVNKNTTIMIGTLAGENIGVISVCDVKCDPILKMATQASTSKYAVSVSAHLYIGGICGKDSGSISDSSAEFSFEAEQLISGYGCIKAGCYQYGSEYNYLYVGGISGAEIGSGTLNNNDAIMTCVLYYHTSLGSYGRDYPYTYIGGITGRMHDSSSMTECYSRGEMDLKILPAAQSRGAIQIGGVVGSVDSGNVNNCASNVNLTLTEGYGGYMGGIVGAINQNARVSNVAYYGEISTVSYSGGYFAGIAGYVAGTLTKAYFHGKILTDSANSADGVGYVEASGAVSKIIGNGNKTAMYCTNEGSVTNCYKIGTDYGEILLFSENLLFNELCLFETDIWGVNSDIGLYLLSFPEYELTSEE